MEQITYKVKFKWTCTLELVAMLLNKLINTCLGIMSSIAEVST